MKNRILVVDDSPSAAQYIGTILKEKYVVKITFSGEEALDIIEAFNPDLVMLDAVMKGIDGYDVCRKIRDKEIFKQTKIIMLSGGTQLGKKLEGYSSGVDDYIEKPFHPEELLAKVKVFIRLKILEDQLCHSNMALNKRTRQLETIQQELIENAHKAGMADIAITTIHSVGNCLTSIKTSSQMATNILKTSQLDNLNRANIMLRANLDNLTEFICHDPKGKKLMLFYLKLEEALLDEKNKISGFLKILDHGVDDIEQIIVTQQNYAGTQQVLEKYSISQIIEDILTMQSQTLKDNWITVNTNFQEVPCIKVQKTKVLYILFGIIHISINSMTQKPKDNRELTFHVFHNDKGVFLNIINNGHGYTSEELRDIFANHTDNQSQQTVGLHNSANFMTEMKGRLWVESQGPGTGATFILQFPLF